MRLGCKLVRMPEFAASWDDAALLWSSAVAFFGHEPVDKFVWLLLFSLGSRLKQSKGPAEGDRDRDSSSSGGGGWGDGDGMVG